MGAGEVNVGDFGIRNDTDGVEALNISAVGNVGIGMTSPVYKLDVVGSAQLSNPTADCGLVLNGGSANASDTVYFQRSGGTKWCIGLTADGVPNFGIISELGGGQAFTILATGNVGIGTTSPAYLLDVAGQVHATSFVASSGNNYADFVFKPGYKLPPLSDVEASIQKDGHLPGIPSEAEAKANGIDLASMQVKLLQKIEELTLHQIDQEKHQAEQEKRIEQLEKENTELLERLTK